MAREMASFIATKGLVPVAIGLAVGLGVAAFSLPALADLLYGSGSIVRALSVSAGVIVVAATAACALPARRAMQIDPLKALRAD